MDAEVNWVKEWVRNAEKDNDQRRLYGAFKQEELVGFIGASKACQEDAVNGLEINYLFLKKAYRGLGISMKLIQHVFNAFEEFEHVIVYNYQVAPSNKYYRHLGGSVLRIDQQGKYLVDIFRYDYQTLKDRIFSPEAQ